MAQWVKIPQISSQFNLVSGDKVIGQLYFDYRVEVWVMYLSGLNRTNRFRVALEQTDTAMNLAAEWVLATLREEIEWMREASSYLAEFSNRLPVFRPNDGASAEPDTTSASTGQTGGQSSS